MTPHPSYYSDDDYKHYISTITDPYHLLSEIKIAVRDGLFGHDPYFADLKKHLLNRAEELICEHEEKSRK